MPKVTKPKLPGTVVTEKPSLADRLTSPKPTVAGSHLLIEARAGTGKTTTLVEGLKLLKGLVPSIKPSEQQRAIWDAMLESKSAVDNGATIGFTAFNKSIAEELQRRVPAGVTACTMHSLGNSAVTRAFGRIQPTEWTTKNMLSDLMGKPFKTLIAEQPALVNAVDSLVNLVKSNLTGTDSESLYRLSSHYDVDLGDMPKTAFQMVEQIVELSKNPSKTGKMSFTDMIWLPVVLKLPVSQYDLLLVDEAQDLNRCQQALAKMSGRRLILCGDPKQAIYGFAGADAESLPRMYDELSETLAGCTKLALNVTRRCGKAIVTEAQKYVPDFFAHESNPAGQVLRASYGDKHGTPTKDSYHGLVKEGDMVLCRVNAPLVRQCFIFIKLGKRANIQGRDVGQGLVSTIKKLMKDFPPEEKGGIPILLERLDGWLATESDKERAKANPSEAKLIALADRHECLNMFCDDRATIQQVIDAIGEIFTDKNEPGIRLSSIHKAKGLEAHRVFLLQPEGASMPHPMAKTEWARGQEFNLLYVSVTRAIETLYHVS